jgi:hypothetical protein
MIKTKTFLACLIALLIMTAILMGGCQKAPAEEAPNPFTTTWVLGEDGRGFSISGNAAGHVPGGQSEFLLIIDNNSGAERWQGEYCIVLVDTNGVVNEATHEQFDIPAGSEEQQPVFVDFPEDYEGPLGLCVAVPQRGTTVTTVWVGSQNDGSAGPWPIFKTCPCYLTEEGSRQLAERFVRQSPTFAFDGNEETLELVKTLKLDSENGWQFVYHFESAHAGYGDRTGQMLAEVITSHEAKITIEQGEIKAAVMDEKWDMLEQRMINDIEISLAPIHEVEVLFMESFPVQVGVRIKGGLRDGCTTFRDAMVTREGDTVNIEVTVQKPKGKECPAVYTLFEKNLNLGSDFTAGAIYNLKVNDYATTFEMP